jgi:hypothetical protein
VSGGVELSGHKMEERERRTKRRRVTGGGEKDRNIILDEIQMISLKSF